MNSTKQVDLHNFQILIMSGIWILLFISTNMLQNSMATKKGMWGKQCIKTNAALFNLLFALTIPLPLLLFFLHTFRFLFMLSLYSLHCIHLWPYPWHAHIKTHINTHNTHRLKYHTAWNCTHIFNRFPIIHSSAKQTVLTPKLASSASTHLCTQVHRNETWMDK